MAEVIKFKRKRSTGNESVNLLSGEPYYNIEDGKFYIGVEDNKIPDLAINQPVRKDLDTEDAENNRISIQIGPNENNKYEKTIYCATKDRLGVVKVGDTVALEPTQPHTLSTERSNYYQIVANSDGQLFVNIPLDEFIQTNLTWTDIE